MEDGAADALAAVLGAEVAGVEPESRDGLDGVDELTIRDREALLALGSSLGLMRLSWLLYKSLHHRGPLHSILFTLAVTAAVCFTLWWFWWPWDWGLAFGWGWMWHILADGLTSDGVPFF